MSIHVVLTGLGVSERGREGMIDMKVAGCARDGHWCVGLFWFGE